MTKDANVTASLSIISDFYLFWVVSGKHKSIDNLESKNRGKFVLGSFLRDWFYWFIDPFRKFAILIGLGPLFFNLLGVFSGF